MEKTDRNLKNTLWTHTICTTTLPTPKFRPSLILWTHVTQVKILTHVTPVFFLSHAKILWTHATHAFFLTHAKILPTHATHTKVWPTPPTNPRCPRHPRYLADSFQTKIVSYNYRKLKNFVSLVWKTISSYFDEKAKKLYYRQGYNKWIWINNF